ncbi:MAG: hypothetical protein ACRC62_30625 [Microcoleus sp.]
MRVDVCIVWYPIDRLQQLKFVMMTWGTLGRTQVFITSRFDRE